MLAKLKEKTVAVTGATGFIGSRVTEVLTTKYGVKVRALLNRYSTASRISRFNIELVKCDLADVLDVKNALNNCDYLVHCAYDWTNEKLNIEAGINLIDVASQAGIKQVIHLSTISVYEPPQTGVWTENTAKGPHNDSYGKNKLAVENAILRRAKELRQPVVVLQLSIVYGPWGFWSTGPLDQLARYNVVLVNGGNGLCSPVYIDDVVDAISLGLVHEDVNYETFLISGPDFISWKDFWGKYEEIIGQKSTISHTVADIDALRRKFRKEQSTLTFIRNALADSSKRNKIFEVPLFNSFRNSLKFVFPPKTRPVLKKILKNIFLNKAISKAQTGHTKPLLLPNQSQIPLFSSTARMDISKAMKMIGYNPQIHFDDGMSRVEKWAKWANLIVSNTTL